MSLVLETHRGAGGGLKGPRSLQLLDLSPHNMGEAGEALPCGQQDRNPGAQSLLCSV